MSEKVTPEQFQMNKALIALQLELPEAVYDGFFDVFDKYVKSKDSQLHSLRLAVLEYLNKSEFKPGDPSDKGFTDLALSAGIVFENGTWILKEGE